jgi:alpha-ketoglutarate-dependent taurine dioxygenase
MESSEELPVLSGASVRLPEEADGPFRSRKQTLPLIVTSHSGDTPNALDSFIRSNSTSLLDSVCRFGAVLIRGFHPFSEQDFESAMLSFEELQPMRSYFMSEPGRDHAGKGTGVFLTNSLIKIGGGLYPPGRFHAENYHIWDAPAMVGFWCKKASWLGGETAFVHMASVYDELPARTRARLESGPVFVTAHPLSEIAARYDMPEATLEEFLIMQNVAIEKSAGVKYAVLCKPTVWRHPDTDRLSLQANVSVELDGLDTALQELMAPYYAGWKWAFHRFVWRHPALPMTITAMRNIVRHPVKSLQPSAYSAFNTEPFPDKDRLRDKIEDVAALARAMWRHTSVLTWQEGDLLIFDNRQLLHAGMPGLGPRALRVLMFNPVPIDWHSSFGVLDTPPIGASGETLDARLDKFLESIGASDPGLQQDLPTK